MKKAAENKAMNRTEDQTITVDDRTFQNVEALQAHVDELIETRGSVYTPRELKAIQTLASISNGSSSPNVARIARSSALLGPKPRRREPTPFDARIEAAAQLLAKRDAELEEALSAKVAAREAGQAEYRRAAAQAETRGQVHDLTRLSERIRERIRQVEEDYDQARERRLRAKTRHTALKLTADRWRYSEENERTRRK